LPILPASRLCKLGDLRPRPRFYFNATCTESGRSIVFTQSVLHRDLSGDPVARLPSDPLLDWAEGRDVEEQSRSEPLSSATTLEDLGSSTAAFPLAYAVFASAAFPGVFQPLQLQKFVGAGSALAPAGSKPPPVWRREGLLTIVDGAMYDNTGRTTALEVFAYLRKRAASDTGAGRLVLLVIDADNDPDSYKGPDTSPRLPWHVDLPVRGLLPAVSTVARLYNKQQSLVRAALARRIQAWVKEGVLDYFEIRLMDVTHQAEQIRAIPTDFVITDFEDARLKEAVRELLNRPRSGNTGPTVASAFVDAVRAARARSQ
jgi:hypothetical protein